MNPRDVSGRQPIHIAVTLGITDSVRYLLTENCGISTPPSSDSLLQLALKLQDPEKSQILRLLVPVLIDRHRRLQDMASNLLPPSVYFELELAPGKMHERKAPLMVERLIAHGLDVPQALELDGKSFYNFADFFGDAKMTPEIANAFWDAGFCDIDMPDENGVTPFLQSWYCANFKMVDWFAQRGVSMKSKHESASLTALHLYAKRLYFPGTGFGRDVDAVPTNEHYMDVVQRELRIPYDDCQCTCSPGGCAPIKFLFDKVHEDGHRKSRIRRWFENVRPSQALELQYVYDLTRYLLFDFLDGEHTCCCLGQECHVIYDNSRTEPSKNRWNERTRGMREKAGEHRRLCENGIPIPRRESLYALKDPDIFETTLNSAMSYYDEMDRPDDMPLEEQVFRYINWLLTEGHLNIDVSYECVHFKGW